MISKEKIKLGVLENVLGYLLAQVSISTNQVFKKNIVALHNLNKLEFTALILIKNNPNLTLKNLVEILNIPASNLSLLLLKLEELKLIARNKSTLDQRVQMLTLTSSGKKVASSLEKISSAMENELLSKLDTAEREKLFQLLRQLMD